MSPPRCRDSLDFAAVGLALLDLAKGHALRLLLLLQMLLLMRLILSGPGLGEFICGLMAFVSQTRSILFV